MTFSDWLETGLDGLRHSVHGFISKVEFMAGGSTRTAEELLDAAMHLRITADYLDREAKKLKEAQHEHA